MMTRPGQDQLSFTVFSDRYAKQQTAAVAVQLGLTTATDAVALMPATAPVLSLPPQQLTAPGKISAFTVSAVDPGGLPVTLSAAGLPAGAAFDPITGNFIWTPRKSHSQPRNALEVGRVEPVLGTYHIAFTATNSASASSSGEVVIHVDSGKPVITDVRNAASQIPQSACSPGSAASLVGRWLASNDPPVSDPSGASVRLGGTRVNVNGTYVPVLYASRQRVDFLCPNADPGTALAIFADTDAGVTDPVETTMRAVDGWSLFVGWFRAGAGNGHVSRDVFAGDKP